MEYNKDKSLLVNCATFSGVEFSIVNHAEGDKVEAEKKLNLFSALELYDLLKDNLKTIGYHLNQMNMYRHYADDVDSDLDKQETHFDKENRVYSLGGNFAFFLQTKKDLGGDSGIIMADNNAAGDILKKAYKKAYPKNKIRFDAEMSYCYVETDSREEAKRFTLWMNEKYIKPWVDQYVEEWDEFVKLYDESTDERKSRLALLVNEW
jgi:hypothetical protein